MLGLVGACALGAACGGDDDEGGDAGTSAPVAATAAPAPETTAAAPATSAAAPATSAAGGADTTAAGGAAEGGAGIVITDFTFAVAGPVAAGSTVTVQNDDTEAHTVTADDGSFNVEIAGGGTAEFTAPAAGSYAFVCNFHANMMGSLTVE